MPPKPLQQIAAKKFASTYLAPNLEFLYATPEKSQRKLIDFFVHNPPEICLEAILAISIPILRAQLFVFLQENANTIINEIIKQRREALSLYDDVAQKTDTQTIHNDINTWRTKLGRTIGISNAPALDAERYIYGFNRQVKSQLFKAKFSAKISSDSVYYNPLSDFFTARKHDASDIVSLAVLGLLPTLQQTYSSLNDADKQAAIEALITNKYRHTDFEFIVEDGLLETVQWIYGKLNKADKLAALTANNYNAFRVAAQNGHLETVQWIYEKLEETDEQAALAALATFATTNYLAFKIAAHKGYLETAQWIYEKLEETDKQAALATLEQEEQRKFLLTLTASQNNNTPNESPNLNLYSVNFIGSSSSSSSVNVGNNAAPMITKTLTNN